MFRNFLTGCLFAVLIVGVVGSTANAVNAQDKDKPAELRALEHYIGEWETVAVSKPSTLAAKEFSVKGTMTREWVLNGRFVQEKFFRKGGGNDTYIFMSMITYDPQKKAYRCWYFDVGGDSMEQVGQWDEATKTFTWKGELSKGITITGFTRYPDANTMEWQGIAKEKDGKVYFHGEGKGTRTKK